MKKTLIIILALFAVASGVFYFYFHAKGGSGQAVYKTAEERDKYVRFGMEMYDKITDNYWNKGKDGDLAQLFLLATEKVADKSESLQTSDRTGTAKMLYDAISSLDDSAKKKFVIDLGTVILYNLAPQGRNQIMTSAQQTELRQTVANVNPTKDLYQELGVKKGASSDEIQAAYITKRNELKASTTQAVGDMLKEISYAKETLLDQNKKQLYDQGGIEPTVFSKKISPNVYYIYISKISPTTLNEFGQSILSTASSTALNSMIIDLRSNVGGALDFLQYFLGLFIGNNQYAFDLYHQGNYNPTKTVISKLSELKKFRKIVLLTDNMTQSTAELITAAFKRYNLAVVVGDKTRGWGSVENTYDMATVIDPTQKYTLLLVNSLTLRDDNQPIEGNGVDPDVNIKDINWKQELSDYFDSKTFIDSVIQTVSHPPAK